MTKIEKSTKKYVSGIIILALVLLNIPLAKVQALIELPGSLAAEDFGVVSYDTGLGMLKGYTAGFGLTDATFEDVQSVVIKLYAGNQLLQTNTATAKVGDEITGVQISSPFDVSGDFDYATDGYWTNSRETEYGQSMAATKVVATVQLENGKTVTAENTNLTGDPETIFPEEQTVKVTVVKFVNGSMATALNADNANFDLSSTWNATNIGPGTGTYSLSENNSPTAYQTETSAMSSGADYTTSETMNDVVGASCDAGKPFALAGYTSGDTLAAAMAATPSMTAPALTNITTNKWIIVWNTDCANPGGTIGGDVVGGTGTLAVTSVEAVDTSAIADGTFGSGWKFVFHVTVPTNEDDLAMKFADWAKTGGGGTIPAASNIRISSDQADNSGATVLVTAANTYTTPALHITDDLDTGMDGMQVEVTVEVAVPVGTPNGSYTTSYGVKTE